MGRDSFLRLFPLPARLNGLGNYCQLRQLLAFGTGAGIQIAGPDLEIAVARVRPTGVQVLARRMADYKSETSSGTFKALPSAAGVDCWR